jgi:hypothetical protein
MRPCERYAEECERVPEVISNGGLIHGEQLRREPLPECMRAERPQCYRGCPGQRCEDEEQLQRVFFAFFTRCGRFLP